MRLAHHGMGHPGAGAWVWAAHAQVEHVEIRCVDYAVQVTVEAGAQAGGGLAGAELPRREIALVHVPVPVGVRKRRVARRSGAAERLDDRDGVDVPAGRREAVVRSRPPSKLDVLADRGCGEQCSRRGEAAGGAGPRLPPSDRAVIARADRRGVATGYKAPARGDKIGEPPRGDLDFEDASIEAALESVAVTETELRTGAADGNGRRREQVVGDGGGIGSEGGVGQRVELRGGGGPRGDAPLGDGGGPSGGQGGGLTPSKFCEKIVACVPSAKLNIAARTHPRAAPSH